MDGGRRDPEVALHVGFGGRPFVDGRVGVNEGEILALLFGEARPRKGVTRDRVSIHQGSFRGGSPDEHTLRVELSQDEREELTALLKSGRHAVRKVKRAQILLAADDGVGDGEVAARVGAGGSTVYRTKRRFVEGNLELALVEAPRPGAQRKLSGKEEALLIATACSAPPAGRARWTLELLADVMVALTEHEGLARDRASAPGGERAEALAPGHVVRSQGRRRLCRRHGGRARPLWRAPDPTRPVICFDESPTQLIGEVRAPIPAEPGRLERFDFEYKRNGTVNLFIFLDVNRPWRKVKVTERRAAADFSQCMRELSDVHFPEAEKIRVVMDNLSTHSPASLYNALPAPEARRILRRLEFHFTPKHASWLNMVEIEIGVLRGQCLDRRISQSRHPRSRDRRLGATAQRQRRAHQMDVHDGESQTQTESRLVCRTLGRFFSVRISP